MSDQQYLLPGFKGFPAIVDSLFNSTALPTKLAKYLKSGFRNARTTQSLELEQIFMRFAVGFVITVYVVASYILEQQTAPSNIPVLALLLSAWIINFVLLGHIIAAAQRYLERRIFSLTLDAVAISLFLHYGEKSAAIFFPIYLWITLGCGFRFGVPYMYGSMAASSVGFMIMVETTPYWKNQWYFSLGLLLAIVAIPLYVSSLIRQLRLAMINAEAANSAKTSFMSVMSHELRTPLNAILGLAQLSQITAKSQEERTSALWTEMAAQRLMRMVETILNFQRVESGVAQISERLFDPLNMLFDVKALLVPIANKKKLAISFVFETGLPETLISDQDILQTILINLGSNAVKYTKTGGVEIKIALLDQKTEKPILRFQVQDTGIGIDVEFQPYIYDRFTRGDRVGDDDEGGVGLGLSLCRSLVEMMDGTISCYSEPGRGSRFQIDIPVKLSRETNIPSCLEEFSDIEIDFVSCQLAFDAYHKDRLNTSSFTIKNIIDTPEFLDCLRTDQNCSTRIIVATPKTISEISTDLNKHQHDRNKSVGFVCWEDEETIRNKHERLSASFMPNDDRDFTDLIQTIARWKLTEAKIIGHHEERVKPVQNALTILVADDSLLNLEVVRRMLDLNGHIVIEAKSGEEALDILLHQKVDLALLDINMPDINGIEICQIYQSSKPANELIPIVALTADTSGSLRSRCVEVGMKGVLSKPLSIHDLRVFLSTHQFQTHVPAAIIQGPIEEETPVVDRGRLEQLSSLFGKNDLENDLLIRFETDMKQSLSNLKIALRQSSLKEARDIFHAIRSSANTIGASRLSKKAMTFEDADCFDQNHATIELEQEVSTYLRQARADIAVASYPFT